MDEDLKSFLWIFAFKKFGKKRWFRKIFSNSERVKTHKELNRILNARAAAALEAGTGFQVSATEVGDFKRLSDDIETVTQKVSGFFGRLRRRF